MTNSTNEVTKANNSHEANKGNNVMNNINVQIAKMEAFEAVLKAAERGEIAADVVSMIERDTAEALHAAGWALAPQYTKKEERTLHMAMTQLGMYHMGRIILEPAEVMTDMFTGRTLFIHQDEYRDGVRIIHKEQPFYGIASDRLENSREQAGIRGVMKKAGIKLRNAQGLEDMREAKRAFYTLRDDFQLIMPKLEAIMGKLMIEGKVQAVSLHTALKGTGYVALAAQYEGRRHLIDSETVLGVMQAAKALLDDTRERAFLHLPQDLTPAQIKTVLSHPAAKTVVTKLAEREALALHDQRFWLAFALTMGEPAVRVANVTPELLKIAEHLEKSDEALDLLGVYDAYERSATPGMDKDGTALADGRDKHVRAETMEAYNNEVFRMEGERNIERMLEIIAEVGGELSGVQDAYWDEGAGMYANRHVEVGSMNETTIEDLLEAGKIPVHVNRFRDVEKKILRLQERKAKIELLSKCLGKRADDMDWVIETAQWSLPGKKEEALALLTGGRTERARSGNRILREAQEMAAFDMSAII